MGSEMSASDIKMSDIKIYSTEDFPAYLPRLNHLYDSLFAGGKGFRAHLVSQIAALAQLTEDSTKLLAQTVEFIHSSSLLHDDLIDRSPLRRGKTAAWLEYGAEYSVLAGDYLLARVIVNLSNHGHIGLVKITGQALSELLEGEWLQDAIRHTEAVTWEQMDRIHRLKTSSLFAWCLKAPFVFLNREEALIEGLQKIGSRMGALLQRSDDLLDFNIRNFENKASFSDLKAGYLNLFSIFLFETPEQRKRAWEVENIEQVYALVGEAYFAEKLKQFDDLNQQLIDEILTDAAQLQKQYQLHPDFVDFLKAIVPKLYWRQ